MATNDSNSAGCKRHDGRTNDSGCAQPRGPAPHSSDRNVLMELLRLASGDRLPDRVNSVGFAVSAISLVYPPRLRTYSGLLQTDTLGHKRSSRLPHILLVSASSARSDSKNVLSA
jgi:hypothetical protein